jgi:hypothetical protein
MIKMRVKSSVLAIACWGITPASLATHVFAVGTLSNRSKHLGMQLLQTGLT